MMYTTMKFGIDSANALEQNNAIVRSIAMVPDEVPLNALVS